MPDQIQSQRVVSQGGLNTLNNYLTLSQEQPGAAVRLQNFESSLSGGYRRINGYRPYDVDFPEVGDGIAEGGILGVWIFYNTTTKRDMIIAARKTIGVDRYNFYYYSLGFGWIAFVTGLTFASENVAGTVVVRRIRAEIFNHGDGNQIIFVDGVNNATVYDGTNWTSITPTVGPSTFDQALAAPAVVTAFKNHIFVSGDETYPAVVAHCAPSNIQDWSAASGGGQLVFGFDVVQIKPFRDELFVFGKSNIKKIVEENATFVFKDVTNNLGCVARDSVLEINGSLIFLSQDGIRPVTGTDKSDGVELGLLSQNIQDLIDAISIDYDLDYLNGVVIRSKSQFRYFLSNDAYAQQEGYGILGCTRINPVVYSSSTSRWEFSTIYGIRSSACWSGIMGTREIILHGDYDGIVYQQELGNDFNGSDIMAIYTTPFLDSGDTEIRKLPRQLNIFLKAEGTFTINIGVRYDWGLSEAVNPPNYSGQINGAFTYDDPLYTYDDPDSVYGGLARTVFDVNVQGGGRSVQYIFSSIGFAPYTIHGFVQEISTYGRQ